MFGKKNQLIAELRNELAHYKSLAENGLEPRIESMKMENGNFDLSVTGPLVEYISAVFVGHFKALGATNYVEFNLHDNDSQFQRYTLTIQKQNGKSPVDLLKEAEAKLAAQADSQAVSTLTKSMASTDLKIPEKLNADPVFKSFVENFAHLRRIVEEKTADLEKDKQKLAKAEAEYDAIVNQ